MKKKIFFIFLIIVKNALLFSISNEEILSFYEQWKIIKKDISIFFVNPDENPNKIFSLSQKETIFSTWEKYSFLYEQLESKVDKSHLLLQEMGYFFIEHTYNYKQYYVFFNERNNKQIFFEIYNNTLLNNKLRKEKSKNKKLAIFYKQSYKYCKLKKEKYGKIFYLNFLLNDISYKEKEKISPFVNKVILYLGRRRISNRKGGLINDSICYLIEEKLQPGDIIIERKNWYLSNLGIPGYWGHSALYLGDLKKLESWSNDSQILTYVKEKTGKFISFTEYLEDKYPQIFKLYKKETKNKIKNPGIIEALAEGVLFFSIKTSIGISDCIGVLRPNLSKLDIAKAIEKAFSYYNYSYDFDFDFDSEKYLFCSELIFRSYESQKDKKGLDFSLINIYNRQTLPANEIVRQYVKNKDLPLTFILFVDVNEENNFSYFSTKSDFDKSYLRPNWKFQKNKYMKEQEENRINNEDYYCLPINMAFNMRNSFATFFCKGKKIENYFSINPFSARADRLRGIDFTTFWNAYNEDIKGIQLAGLINSTINNSLGFQIAGLSNISTKDFGGIQGSIFSNYCGENFWGMQFSLLDNNAYVLKGLQVSSSNKTMINYGLQLGLVNYAKRNEALQIGLLNLAEQNNFLSLGFFSNNISLNLFSNLKDNYFGFSTNEKYFKNHIFYGNENKFGGGFGMRKDYGKFEIALNYFAFFEKDDFLYHQINIQMGKSFKKLKPYFSVAKSFPHENDIDFYFGLEFELL